MVYSALFCPIDKEKQLKEMECAGDFHFEIKRIQKISKNDLNFKIQKRSPKKTGKKFMKKSTRQTHSAATQSKYSLQTQFQQTC